MRGKASVFAIAAALVLMTMTALYATGNLEQVTDAGKITTKGWPASVIPIVWRYHDATTVAGCWGSPTVPASALQPAAANGFTTWQNNPDPKIAFSYGGVTTGRNIRLDGVNVRAICD